MLEIKRIKKENGEIGISFVIQTAGIKQKYSALVSVFCSTRERIEQRLRLFRLALQVMRADPNEISLEKNGKENQLSFAWKDDSKRKIKGAKNFWCIDNSRIVTLDEIKGLFQNFSHSLEIFRAKFFKTIRKAHLVIQNNKKKIVKVATGVSAIALIAFATISLMPFINATNENPLCPSVDVDVVLVMDTTESMQSICTWHQYEDCGSQWLWVEHKDYGVTREWCEDEVRNHPPHHPSEYNSEIDDAKTAAKLFVGELGTDDQSALVSFNTTASLDKQLSNEHLVTETSTEAAIDTLIPQAGTGTDIAGAIDAANIELTANGNPQAIKAAILLTDGQDPIPADAIARATEAAALGYKIFTIGLGTGADPVMLQSIASVTHAQYHYAATGSDLAGIYEEIAGEICQYGSISGCKYLDSDADGDITDEEPLTGLPTWEINLFDGLATTTQQTDTTGCYAFAGLLAGEYTISEVLQEGWQQTYPFDPETLEPNTYTEIIITNWENFTNKNFANYFPCDDGDPCTDNIFNLETYTCEEPIYNTNQCDDNNLCTENDICSDGVCSGTCTLGEPCDDGDPNTMNDVCTQDGDECICVGESVQCHVDADCDDGIECTVDSCVDGECQYDDLNCPTEPICGNGILEQGEECDGDDLGGQTCASQDYDSGTLSCSADCAFEFSNCTNKPTPPSGGGGAVMIPHSILDVRPIDIVGDSVTITWRTSFFATSQVIYSIEGEIHNFDPDNPPLYGYAHMTPEQDTNPKVTYHTVVIPELSPEQTYYYRTISRASPAVFSPEFTFTTLASLEEDDASETDETQEQESATEEDSSDEFVSDESAASEELSLEEMEEKLNEISNKVATIGQEVAKISPRVNVPAFASVDSSAESLASNDLDSEADDEEPLFADATADKASFAEGTTNKVNNEINDESDNSKFLAGIGTFFSNLEGWRLALIFLLGIILALIILRLIKSLVGGNKNK